MQVEWHLMYQNFTFYTLRMDTERIHTGFNTFGSYMAFDLQLTSPIEASTDDLTFINGSISWGTDSMNTYSPFLIPNQPLHSNRMITVPISKDQVKQIEDSRLPNQEIQLNISLSGICHIPLSASLSIDNKQSIAEKIKGRNITLTGTPSLIQINRDKWSEMLRTMGYESYRLVELPKLEIRSRQKERWDKVINRYEIIVKKEGLGDYEDCIEESRLLVDEILSVLAPAFNINTGNMMASGDKVQSFLDQSKKAIPNPSDQDHLTSFGHLLFALTSFSRSYHHGGNIPPTISGNLRQQASYAVMLATNVISAGARMLSWRYLIKG